MWIHVCRCNVWVEEGVIPLSHVHTSLRTAQCGCYITNWASVRAANANHWPASKRALNPGPLCSISNLVQFSLLCSGNKVSSVSGPAGDITQPWGRKLVFHPGSFPMHLFPPSCCCVSSLTGEIPQSSPWNQERSGLIQQSLSSPRRSGAHNEWVSCFHSWAPKEEEFLGWYLERWTDTSGLLFQWFKPDWRATPTFKAVSWGLGWRGKTMHYLVNFHFQCPYNIYTYLCLGHPRHTVNVARIRSKEGKNHLPFPC